MSWSVNEDFLMRRSKGDRAIFSRVKSIIESRLHDAIMTKHNHQTEILPSLAGFLGI